MENRDYPVIYRVMHWAIALCIFFLLLTIFLRLTWMNKDHMADIIQGYLASTDKTFSREELVVLAKQIRKPMWNWHVYAGYVLTGLFAIRLILPFWGKMEFLDPFKKQLVLKERFQYWVYIVFNICVAVSLLTGLLIEFGPRNLRHTTEEIHVLSIYYLIAFLVIHFGGVLLAEFTAQHGIISRIVSGSKQKEQ